MRNFLSRKSSGLIAPVRRVRNLAIFLSAAVALLAASAAAAGAAGYNIVWNGVVPTSIVHGTAGKENKKPGRPAIPPQARDAGLVATMRVRSAHGGSILRFRVVGSDGGPQSGVATAVRYVKGNQLIGSIRCGVTSTKGRSACKVARPQRGGKIVGAVSYSGRVVPVYPSR